MKYCLFLPFLMLLFTLDVASQWRQANKNDNIRAHASVFNNSDPSLDSTFGINGIVLTSINTGHSTGGSIAISPDGKIVQTGRNDTIGENFVILRYNIDGSLDSPFGTNGLVISNPGGMAYQGNSVAVQVDNKIIIVGGYSDRSGPNIYCDYAIVRYNPDGSLDSTFHAGPIQPVPNGPGRPEVNHVACLLNGKILMVGNAGWMSPVIVVGQLASDGILDYLDYISFARRTRGGAMGIQANGKIIVTGSYSMDYPDTLFTLRFNSNGSRDDSYPLRYRITGVNPSSVAIQADAKIVIAGNTDYPNDSCFVVLRYKDDGSLDSTFNSIGMIKTQLGNPVQGNAMVIQPDGKIIVGGTSNGYIILVRYWQDGTLDETFGTNGIATISAGECSTLAVQSDGKIVLGGTSGSDFMVLRLKKPTYIPSAPLLFSPAQGTINQSIALKLRWNHSLEATSYKVQVATDSAFITEMVFDDSSVIDTFRNIITPAYYTKYYWHVQAKNFAGVSSYSDVWNFSTLANGSISGLKFDDQNENGINDTLEPGLPGWKIKISGAKNDSVLTGTDGFYMFTNLSPGSYTVSEVQQSGWEQSYPTSPGTYTVTLSNGDSLTGKNFGNYQPYNDSITIRKFKDLDGNFSTREDLVLQPWRLKLYKTFVSPANLVKDTIASSFTVTNIQPGTYIATEDDSIAWIHIGKLRDTSAFGGYFNSDTFAIARGQSRVIDFINFNPNKVVVYKQSDLDGNFQTTNDRTFKKWHLTLYKSLIAPGNIVSEVISAESLVVNNLGDGTYKVLETDSAGWTHIGTILDGVSNASNLNIVEFVMNGGETHIVKFVNTHLGGVMITKLLDQDGDYRTSSDRTPKAWALKLYKDSISPVNLIDQTASSPTLNKLNLPEGNYVAVEADSGYPWSHIQTVLDESYIGGSQNSISFALAGGESRNIKFVNFDRNRPKIWTAAQDCEWSNGNNWDPPGVPIPGDTIFVPANAKCALTIPPCATLGTIAIAGAETVKVNAGSALYVTGDADINGILVVDSNDTSIIHICGNWSLWGEFRAGKSIVIFPGNGKHAIKGKGHTFYRIIIGGPECRTCESGPMAELVSSLTDTATLTAEVDVTVSNQITLNANIDATGKSLFISNPAADALSGPGKVLKGTIKRSITQGSTGRYQFESDKTYVQFNNVGTYPKSVSFTVHPDTIPADTGQVWEVIPSAVDPVNHVVFASNVDWFSIFSFGVSSALPTPSVHRIYATTSDSGNGFSANLSFRYDPSEVPGGVNEGQLVLMRLIGNGLSSTVAKGWNIISVPLKMVNTTKEALFPSSVSNAFLYSDGYITADTFENGIGYWLKFDRRQMIAQAGYDRLIDTINVKEGWNLVGSLSIPLPTRKVISLPGSILTGQFFAYNSGYQAADTMYPMKGYWIKSTAGGQLIMNPSLMIARQVFHNDGISGLNSMVVQDARKNTQTLYFGTRTGGLEASGDLPPVPPKGTFDARFSSGKAIAQCNPKGSVERSIEIMAEEYPVTLTWNIMQTGTPAFLIVSTKEIQISRSGSITLHGPNDKVILRVGGQVGIPKEYALEQNYPNPFNPNTTIRYQLPINSRVILKIYNLLGQVVVILRDGVEDAGYRSTNWNAASVASGMYFYKLEATSVADPTMTFTQVKKMILIK